MSRPFPVLTCDADVDPDPRGIRAYSFDDLNSGPFLAHPLATGQLAWLRYDDQPTGTETLAEISAREKDGWPVDFWIYYLVPMNPRVTVSDLAEASGASVKDLLGA